MEVHHKSENKTFETITIEIEANDLGSLVEGLDSLRKHLERDHGGGTGRIGHTMLPALRQVIRMLNHDSIPTASEDEPAGGGSDE